MFKTAVLLAAVGAVMLAGCGVNQAARDECDGLTDAEYAAATLYLGQVTQLAKATGMTGAQFLDQLDAMDCETIVNTYGASVSQSDCDCLLAILAAAADETW